MFLDSYVELLKKRFTYVDTLVVDPVLHYRCRTLHRVYGGVKKRVRNWNWVFTFVMRVKIVLSKKTRGIHGL